MTQKIRPVAGRLKWLLQTNTLLLALVVAVVVIAVGAGLGYENNKIVPTNPPAFVHYRLEPGNPLSFLSNWDGPDYLSIVQHGYTDVNQTNYFPLYPLAIRVVRQVIGSLLGSALLLSWVSLVGAIYFYIKIVKRLFNVKENFEALRGALFFALFPAAVFLLATYTESLFAFFALGAIYFALGKRYLLAGALAALATATHVTGPFVLVLVFLLLLEQEEKLVKALAALAIGALGLVGYMAYLGVRFHEPLAFIASQRNHGWLRYGRSTVWAQLVSIDGLFVLLVLATAFYWWRKRKSFTVYSLLFAGIPLLGNLGGFPRYSLMAFPAQLMIYDYCRNKKTAYALALVVFAVGWSYFLLQYAGGYIGG